MILSIPNQESSLALSLWNYFYIGIPMCYNGGIGMKKAGVKLNMTNFGFYSVFHELFQSLY